MSKQEKDKDEQKRKAARIKAEYDQAKEKRPGAVRNYDPPVKIKDGGRATGVSVGTLNRDE